MKKTLDQIFEEIRGSEELKKELGEAIQEGKPAILKFLQEHGCDADEKEVRAFMREKADELTEDELTPEELEAAAGGTGLTPALTGAATFIILIGGGSWWACECNDEPCFG